MPLPYDASLKRLKVPVVDRTWQEAHRKDATAINTLSNDVDNAEYILWLMYLVSLEEAIIRGNNGTYSDAQTIGNYQASLPIDPDANITEDLVAGTITIGVDGWYTVHGYFSGEGSAFNNFYGVRIDTSGVDFYLGFEEWTNNMPPNSLVFEGSLKLPLSAGDVISAEVYASGGTYTIAQASLSVDMESLP